MTYVGEILTSGGSESVGGCSMVLRPSCAHCARPMRSSRAGPLPLETVPGVPGPSLSSRRSRKHVASRESTYATFMDDALRDPRSHQIVLTRTLV
jgi:hypothetical protein